MCEESDKTALHPSFTTRGRDGQFTEPEVPTSLRRNKRDDGFRALAQGLKHSRGFKDGGWDHCQACLVEEPTVGSKEGHWLWATAWDSGAMWWNLLNPLNT